MIQIKNRTEYSFKTAYAPIKKVLQTKQEVAAGICDRHGTWGHVQWEKECKAAGLKPIFGVELAVVDSVHKREKQAINYMSFIAQNNEALSEIYRLTTTAHEYFYYVPIIDYSIIDELSNDVFILSGNNPDLERFKPSCSRFFEISPSSNVLIIGQAIKDGHKLVSTSDNYFCVPEDKPAYEIAMGAPRMSADLHTYDMHIVDEFDLRLQWAKLVDEGLKGNDYIAKLCDVELPKVQMVKPEVDQTLYAMCYQGGTKRNINLEKEPYKSRLKRELDLIEKKDFEDYFFVVADLVNYCKRHMLVGPAG